MPLIRYKTGDYTRFIPGPLPAAASRGGWAACAAPRVQIWRSWTAPCSPLPGLVDLRRRAGWVPAPPRRSGDISSEELAALAGKLCPGLEISASRRAGRSDPRLLP